MSKSKYLVCPHYLSYGGTTHGCMLGKFPADCASCTCPDKRYMEVVTSSANTIDLSVTNDATQRQLTTILAIDKVQKWFNGLSDEEKEAFAEKYPEFVIKKEV